MGKTFHPVSYANFVIVNEKMDVTWNYLLRSLILVSCWKQDHHFTWPPKSREVPVVCRANEVPVILRTLGLVQPRESNPRHPALQSSAPPTALILHRLKEANEENASPNVSHNAIRYKTDSVSHTQTNLFSRVLCMTVTLDVLDTHTSLWVEYILSRMASIDSQRRGIFPVLLFT